MSKALRCDRCKTCFDPWTVEGEWATIRDLYFQNSKDYENHEVGYRDEDIHFCPKCAKQFSRWMSTGKKGEKAKEDLSDNLLDFDLDEIFNRLFGGGQ